MVNLPKQPQTVKREGRRFNRIKTILEVLQRVFTFRNIAIVLFLFIAYLFVNSSVFYVNDITIAEIKNKKFIKDSEVFSCTKKFLGKNIFYVQVPEVIDSIQKCTVLVRNVSVNKILPSQIIVSIEEIQPVVKFLFQESCYLVDDRTLIKKIDKENCSNYGVPVVNEVFQADNPFLFNSVVRVIETSKLANQEIPERFDIVFEGETEFIRAHYTDHTVIYSPNIPPDLYVTQYANTLKGLTERGESFKEIDLRFDRVIVR